jgi:hypothetical protein
MKSTEHLRAQIDRSTQRLAQLRARELISEQRDAARTRETNRRANMRRKFELGSLVIAAGAGELDGEELVGALLSYREKVTEPAHRDRYKQQGVAHLASREPGRINAQLH